MTKSEVLKEYFGHDSFREGQEDIIDKLLSGRDVLGVMPTGAGKSMCYQIPALMLSGVTIVVSPLISLMKDQVNSLIQSGVKAAYLNSSLTAEQYSIAMNNAMRGEYKMIYVAPERLCTKRFLAFAVHVRIALIAVDEAHCVSQWGQDFRPSYMQIAEFVRQLSYRPPIAAFTATATHAVRDDIVKMLELSHPYTITTGFDRANLYFEVQKPQDKFAAMLKVIERNKGRCGVIYCSTRKNVDEVSEKLVHMGYSCGRYHAGLSDEERRRNQDDFIYDRIQLIAATNAFGMGIDKSNVAFVIHYNMPKDIESYYQEAGRAGRDGEPAECVLLYSPQDVRTNTFLINHSNDAGSDLLDEETLEMLRRRDLERLKQMTFYCTTSDCLRDFILRYFGERSGGSCSNCSNCNTKFESVDITVDAQKILSCIFRLKQRGLSYGASMVTDILKGSKSQKITSMGLETLSTYGIMQEQAAVRIRRIIEFLESSGYIRRTGEYSVLALNACAKEVLSGGKTLEMKMPKETVKERKVSGGFFELDQELFARLKKLRSALAVKASMPAYIIFSDTTLRDICVKLPTTEDKLLECSGIGSTKLRRYGKDVLQTVKQYIADNPDKADGAEVSPYLKKLRAGRKAPAENSMLFRAIRDGADKLSAVDETLSLSMLCDRIFECIGITADKKVVKSAVENWLVQNDYLARRGEKSGDLALTILSDEAGIVVEQRVSQFGKSYLSIVFPKEAQEFVFENADEIFSQ